MGRQHTWDRQGWAVTTHGGETLTITTRGGATWALRALSAAGQDGLRTTDGASGRFSLLVDQLRGLGVLVKDLPPDSQGLLGFALVCSIEAAMAK
jgi:hypothetical protein